MAYCTVLFRQKGAWSIREIDKITASLHNQVSGDSQHPEYLIVAGQYSRKEVIEALGGCIPFAVQHLDPLTQGDQLPFQSRFVRGGQ